jgi:hypothetical protein
VQEVEGEKRNHPQITQISQIKREEVEVRGQKAEGGEGKAERSGVEPRT